MDSDEQDVVSRDDKFPTVMPDLEDLKSMVSEGWAEALDGCCVEPDGVCPHGSPSWLIELGLI
jgi:hypothetical protein